MNLLGILAGELAESGTKYLAGKAIDAYKSKDSSEYGRWLASASSKFKGILESKLEKNETLNVDDLELNSEQMNHVLHLRNTAIHKGLDKFDMEIEGHKFTVKTKTLDLTPIV